MSHKIKRRDLLKSAGLGAVTLGLPGLLHAAGGGAAKRPSSVPVPAEKESAARQNKPAKGERRPDRPATPNLEKVRPKGKPASIQIRRTLPVRYEVDVFVAGGGPAGFAAAIAAAGEGASVFLAEGHSCLGGMGTSGLTGLFMPFTDGINFLAGGVGKRIYQRYQKDGAPPGFPNMPENVVVINAEVLKRVYDDMLIESGAAFTFHTELVGVEMDGSRVTHAVCSGKSGLFAVKAKMFIDGTGNGDLAAWAGAPFEKGDKNGNMMPPTLCSLWTGIDWQRFIDSHEAFNQNLEKAFADGVFTIPDRHMPGMSPWRNDFCGGNLGHCFGIDGTDEASLTDGLVWGRKMLIEFGNYYRNYLKGYENMMLVGSGSLLGVRETRCIMGDYVLDLDDFKKQAVFEDEIGRYCYCVDLHGSSPDRASFAVFEKEFAALRYKKGESYGIPYRTLTPRGLDNVLVAGRCVSTDRHMQSSIRVMPGCYITGQAAGVAAAIAIEAGSHTRGVKTAELQRRLKKMGAYLPNAKV